MGLRRSDSAKTTLSMYISKSSKYQKWLGILNVLLLLGSVSLIFAGQILKIRYYMDQLDMISLYFASLPWMLIGAGLASFMVSSLGFAFSTSERRGLLFVYAASCIILCIVQFLTIFVAMESRRIIGDNSEWQQRRHLDNYYSDPAVKAKWDYLQGRLRCCGAKGYLDYHNLISGSKTCVPSSCCYDYNSESGRDCTQSFKHGDDNCQKIEVITDNLYIRGCLTILEQLYENDLEFLMLVNSIGCVLHALVLIVSTTLAFAFAAQISRRAKREWSPGEDVTSNINGLANDNVINMNDFTQDN